MFRPVKYINKINVQMLIVNTLFTPILAANRNIIFLGYNDTRF